MIRVCLLVLSLLSFSYGDMDQRTTIGARAFVKLIDGDMEFLARIDSGARITSLHAVNIRLDGKKGLLYASSPQKISGMPFHDKVKNEEYKQHIGRVILFDTMNELGEVKHLKARVHNVAKVRNAQGIEYRYVVRLGLKYKGVVKYKSVNLRDRSKMSYKLLIGRNWLNDDFVIKTDLLEETKK